MVAFASFIFLSGRLALYYVPLAIAVAAAMLASLFVAFGWVPMVLDRWWARPMVRKSSDGPNEIEDPAELAQFVEETPDLDAPLPFFERIFYLKQKIAWVVIPACAVLFVWGWHVYDKMDHFNHYLKEQGRQPHDRGSFPRTDDILSRSINLSVGVVDAGLGAGFGICIASSDEEIQQAADKFQQACSRKVF